MNGYITTCFKLTNKPIYLHQIITNHYGTVDALSVDHINNNKLDNRIINLRIVNQSIQNFNRPKVSRKKSYLNFYP